MAHKIEKSKGHPITYEQLAILLAALVVSFVVGSAISYWFPPPLATNTLCVSY